MAVLLVLILRHHRRNEPGRLSLTTTYALVVAIVFCVIWFLVPAPYVRTYRIAVGIISAGSLLLVYIDRFRTRKPRR